MTDHCHIETRLEIYNHWEMSTNGKGERISRKIEDAIDEIMAKEGFSPRDYFISKSVLP